MLALVLLRVTVCLFLFIRPNDCLHGNYFFFFFTGLLQMPKYYYIERSNVDAERKQPHSQVRTPSPQGQGNNLFMWGQSIYIIACLLSKFLLRDYIMNQYTELTFELCNILTYHISDVNLQLAIAIMTC